MLGLYLHSVLFVYLQLLQFQPRSVDAGLKARYVDALEREILQAGEGKSTPSISVAARRRAPRAVELAD